MGKKPRNLTGAWSGSYAYPGQGLPTMPFLARLDGQGGRLGGETIEPALFGGTGHRAALISGSTHGGMVDFTKTYANPSFGYNNPIDYVGRVSEDGKSITGVWSVLSIDGTFEMHRGDASEEATEEHAEVELRDNELFPVSTYGPDFRL